MNKVYACIDGLASTGCVIDWAAWSALRLEAPLELLHVLDRHAPLAQKQNHSGTLGVDAQEKLLNQLSHEDEVRTRAAREAGRLLLNRLRERALAAGVATLDTRLRHGDVEETLAEQQLGARLLVLGRANAPNRRNGRQLRGDAGQPARRAGRHPKNPGLQPAGDGRLQPLATEPAVCGQQNLRAAQSLRRDCPAAALRPAS